MQLNTLVTVLSVTFLASTAFASGDHAGGHHSDAGAIGQLGNAAKVTRTITVVMTDTMRFSPAESPRS